MGQNSALIRKWFDEVWNNRRKEVIYELADPNLVTYGLAEGQRATGIPEFLPFYERFIATFPDQPAAWEPAQSSRGAMALRERPPCSAPCSYFPGRRTSLSAERGTWRPQIFPSRSPARAEHEAPDLICRNRLPVS